jgi:hypothetical protein
MKPRNTSRRGRLLSQRGNADLTRDDPHSANSNDRVGLCCSNHARRHRDRDDGQGLVLPVAVIVLNVLMAGVVQSAAVLKQRSLKRPVSVTPRLHMFYLGLAAAPVTAAIGWCAMMVIPDVLVGVPCGLAIGSAPVAVATRMLARPRP